MTKKNSKTNPKKNMENNTIKVIGDGYNWMGTFFSSPIIYQDNLFFCADQMYKFLMCKNKDFRKNIINSISVKQLSFVASYKNMQENNWKIREDWKEVRTKKILMVQRYKFYYNPLLAKMLLDTGDRDIIFDVNDNFFGKKDENGENKVGKALMKTREKLKEGDLKVYKF